MFFFALPIILALSLHVLCIQSIYFHIFPQNLKNKAIYECGRVERIKLVRIKASKNKHEWDLGVLIVLDLRIYLRFGLFCMLNVNNHGKELRLY